MPCKTNQLLRVFLSVPVLFLACLSHPTIAAESTNPGVQRDQIAKHWTSERRRNAIPRDLVIDRRGLGYLRGRNGNLTPYGHDLVSRGKPISGGNDNTPPYITNFDPVAGAKIGASYQFSATITDDSGIKSVSFTIQHPDDVTTQSFSPARESGTDTWSINLQGFTDGNWRWWVNAKDTAKRGGNSSSSDPIAFLVDTGGTTPPPTPSGVITNAIWTDAGTVQTAAGRIYFEMPKNAKRKGPWPGYVCSGTVVSHNTSDISLILTAAHCVYDDANKAFARNVLFIPDQAGTTGAGTDLDCSNDPMGCWIPSFGVVDVNWSASVFPNNIAWDYAYYVVNDTGAHVQDPSATPPADDALDVAAGSLSISFQDVAVDDGVSGSDSSDFTFALGYSYSDDPNLMYCAEDMTREGLVNWWLPNCGLSGGSSGGPWIQSMDRSTGSGPVISVNSWGYTDSPGMAGPKLFGTSAECVYDEAIMGTPASTADGDAGILTECTP